MSDATDTVLAWALRYGEAGYRPIPLHWITAKGICSCKAGSACPNPGKHPIEKGWTDSASSDPEVIRRAFSGRPGCNVGLAMGRGIVAVDIDSPYAAEALADRGLPTETPTQHTGGGGTTCCSATPTVQDSKTPWASPRAPTSAPTAGKSSWNPASRTRAYHWDGDYPLFGLEPATLPDFVVDLCHQGGNGNKPPLKTADFLDGISEGERNKKLFAYACKMRRDHRPDFEILAVCLDLARRCKPPLPEDEVGAIVASSAKYEEKPPTGELALANLWRPVDIGCLTTPPSRRRWLLTLPESQGGHGLLPRGKVGILAAEGGTGKTAVMVALAVSAITGRPWLGYYQVPATVAGRVLLLLAEEDGDDGHRRLWKIAEALKLTDFERALLADRLVVIPLAGCPVALTTVTGAGLSETPLAVSLRDRLVRDAGPDGWALVGLDPLSRFAGGDVEGSNEAATRYVEVLESLAAVPGHPTVLVSAHSSKVARRQGQADVRGVTGLSDAARWVATMRRDGEEVHFAVAKSNYSLPCPPLRLHWHEETLVAVSGAEIIDTAAAARAAQGAELDDDVRRVVDVLPARAL